jgi:MoxR-like ATPase
MTPHAAILELQRRMETAIIGQHHVIQRLLLTLLCNGHCLLEGLPGLAKTRVVKSLARHLEAELKRVQFTPDLLPADITGSEIYLGENAQERFVFQAGPIFANLVLADEINRAPAKVQSALLEAMEERQVTVSGKTHTLPELCMVLATENPIEQEGTYPLPEAQKDRFLLHVAMGYPDDASEQAIIRLVRDEKGGDAGEALAPISQHVIFDARAEVHRVEVSDAMEKYMVALIAATRRPAQCQRCLAGLTRRLAGARPEAAGALLTHGTGLDTRSAGTAAIPSRRVCRGGAALHGSVLAGGGLLPGR